MRERENIVRSRHPTVRDAHFQPDNWRPLINFCLACGLRREELRDLRVRDVYHRRDDGHLVVRVVKGKGGKRREVPVFPGREQSVLSVVEGHDPDDHVFDHLPNIGSEIALDMFLSEVLIEVGPPDAALPEVFVALLLLFGILAKGEINALV